MEQKQDRAAIAKRLNEIMGRWKFAPDRKRGRPRKSVNEGHPRVIDPAIVLLLEEAFSVGAPITEATQYAGISRNAFYEWMKINPSYHDRIEELRVNPVMRARKTLFEGIKYDGDLALKFLERRLPEEFSLKATITHSHEFTGISLDAPKVIENLNDPSPEVERLTSPVKP